MQISGGEKAVAALGYLPILFFVPIKLRKDSMFAQFHGRQGAVLFMLWAALMVVCVILLFVPVELINTGAFILMAIATLMYFLLALTGIVKAGLMGERYRMPVVADVALLMGL